MRTVNIVCKWSENNYHHIAFHFLLLHDDGDYIKNTGEQSGDPNILTFFWIVFSNTRSVSNSCFDTKNEKK
jgi:hypothetical protein